MKVAMRAKDSARLGTIRLLLAATAVYIAVVSILAAFGVVRIAEEQSA